MKKIIRFTLALTLVFTTLFTSACGDVAKKDVKFKIVASFYPMYITALNLTDGIDGVEVVNLTNGRVGCLHDYQLTTGNMKTLTAANVFIINGGGMEEFMPRVEKDNPKLVVIDSTKDLNIDWIKDDEGHVNSHVWMNIRHYIEQVRTIAKGLAAADPTHATVYDNNARHYEERLLRLEEEMKKELEGLPHRDVVTYHESFPYFAKEFNINVVANIEEEPGHEPSPRQIEDMVKKLSSLKNKVILTESATAPSSAEMIAYETGAQIYAIDPIEGGESNKYAYIDAMRKNAKALREALK
ncbi:MAG: zinc ABC transporter substrate-binding protein [Selenomonadaceae bacterium]|nr:zinc ABC transporter substrate-binding protein [Selenomonadaceae bacterium]